MFSLKVTVLSLLVALFLILAYRSHGENLYCGKTDQTAYMGTALSLREQGGPASFPKLCFTGAYKQANQQPLYILAISPLAARNIQFFIKAKILSTVIAFVFFLVLFVIVNKEFGFLASAAGISLMLTSYLFIKYLSMVACEYLLITFTLLTWYFTTKGFKDNKSWITGGLFSGLAYLSKASALLYLPVFLLSSFIIALKNNNWKKIFLNKYFVYYFLAFILVSFPLLYRNTVIYNNPFHTVNSKTMWLDNSQEYNHPELIEKSGPVKYFKTHSFDQIFKRVAYGFKTQSRNFFNAYRGYLFDFPDPVYGWYLYVGIYLLLPVLSIAFIFRDNDYSRKIYTVVLFLLFYASLVWFSVIGPSYRYALPVISIFMIYSGVGIGDLLERFAEKIRPLKDSGGNTALMLVAVSLGLICLVTFIKTDFRKNPGEMYAYHDGEEALAGWMKSKLLDRDIVLQEDMYLYPYALTSAPFSRIKSKRIHLPLVSSFAEISDFIKTEQADYVILTKKGIENKKKIFKPYFELTPDESMRVRALPQGWELTYADPEPPVSFLIFKISRNSL
ncbi:MAG: glycosyltransferase family 39 protein [bacterium]